MKLITYRHNNSISCGLWTEKGVVDIPAALDGTVRSVCQILQSSDKYLPVLEKLAQSDAAVIPIDNVTLLAPIPRPPKVLALAGNYRKHIIEAGRELGLKESPKETSTLRPFIMPSTCVTGTGTTVQWPAYSENVDHEIELVIVIGKTAKCVPISRGLDHIAGYSIANDISARTVTFKEGRSQRPWDEFYDWLSGKWSDGFFPFGPCIVTADEIGDPHDLDMKLTVNGETRQNSNTSNMIFSAGEIVSFVSHITTLEPGDVIATGTPEGVAMATKKWLQPGDVVECTIEKIGTLTNTIGQRPNEFYKPI
jgi:2-keto-4-pentenoate hydratase/2-oxohepta-3-ene-1,7-dioic acid hydratase in catechol pathway